MLQKQNASGQSSGSLNFSCSIHDMHITVDWFRMLAQNYIQNPTRHSHSGIELHFLLQGMHDIQVGEQTFKLSAGEMLLIPPATQHVLRNPGGRSYLRYVMNVNFHDDACTGRERFLYEALMQPQPCKMLISPQIQQLLESCQAESTNTYVGYTFMMEWMVAQLLVTLAREISGYPLSTDIDRTKRTYSSQTTEKVIAYIQHHVSQNITVEEIADAMHMSTKHLQRIVQKEKQSTVKDLIVYFRLQTAKEYLKNTLMTISEISENMCFSSEQNFCRFFKNAEGQSPNQYRKGFLGER